MLWFELAGIPHLYGWPLCVIRPKGCDQPPAWVWAVNLAFGITVLAAIWCLAATCLRVVSRGFQFRLATLFGIIAVAAIIAALYRATLDHLDALIVQSSENRFATVVTVDLMGLWNWMPAWLQPVALLVRLGALFGLGCLIYLAGRFCWRLMADRLGNGV